MPRCICKITDPTSNVDYYLEWSTVVDAPISYGMSLEDFKKYYQERYGFEGMQELPERLMRVEANGTSFHPPFHKLEDTLRTYDLNRPKVGDQKEYILENFCRNWRG